MDAMRTARSYRWTGIASGQIGHPVSALGISGWTGCPAPVARAALTDEQGKAAAGDRSALRIAVWRALATLAPQDAMRARLRAWRETTPREL
jgi:hypothetical protein